MTRLPRYSLAAFAAVLLSAAFACAFSSCAHLSPAASCVADPALVPEIVTDLQAPDYEASLEALASRVGLCVVNRTVEAVIASGSARLDAVVVERGRMWLDAHPSPALAAALAEKARRRV